MSNVVSQYYALKFVYMLSKPWTETPAFKLGIIDNKGKALKKLKELDTAEEKKAYDKFTRLVFNLKRIMQKIPLGQSAVARYSSALLLLKESYPGMENEAIEYIKENDMADDEIIEELKENTTAGMDMAASDHFAGCKVFKVSGDAIMKSADGKKRFARYKTYVGEDEDGENIRQYGRKNPGKGIVLKDSTGAMVYLKRPNGKK